MRPFLIASSFIIVSVLSAQDNPYSHPVQTETNLKVAELIQKKAEYHRLTNGVQDGYRIKLHFGVDRDAAENVRTRFATRFPEIPVEVEYQLPNFVVLVGNYRTKLEAYETLQKVQSEFANAFIVKTKVNVTKQ